ncbi:MAG: type II secretion system protein N [Planctomycetota bacterium]
MDTKTQARLLYLAATMFASVSVLGVVWAIDPSTSKVPLAERSGDDGVRSSGESETTAEAPKRIADKTLDLSLQKTLYDPPPPPKPKTTPPKQAPKVTRPAVTQPKTQPKLNWTLAGTLMGLDQPLAILTDATGNTDVSGLGEAVQLSPEGGVVREILPDRVSVEWNGATVSLPLKRSFQSKSPGGNPKRNNRGRNR